MRGRKVAALVALCILCSCGQKVTGTIMSEGDSFSLDNQVSMNTPESEDLYENDEDFTHFFFNGELVEISEFLEGEPIWYTRGDVDGDGAAEIGLMSRRFMCIIKPENKEIIFDGPNYYRFLDSEGDHGLVYERQGGAPDHTTWQYLTLVKDDWKTECEWEHYERDSSTDKDLYLFEGKEYKNTEWYELAGDYIDKSERTSPWFEIETLDGVFAGKSDKLSFEEKVKVYEGEILEKERQQLEKLGNEYNIVPCAYYRRVWDLDNTRLYFFSVRIAPTKEVMNSYLVKETESGVECIFEYYSSARIVYSLYNSMKYDGFFIRHCGSGGRGYQTEDVWFIDGDVTPVYSTRTTWLADYLSFHMNDDYPEGSNLETLLAQSDFIDNIWVKQMKVGEEAVWLVNGSDDAQVKQALDVLNESDLSDRVIFCYDNDEFFEKCKELINRNGISVEEVLNGKPTVGERLTLFWEED